MILALSATFVAVGRSRDADRRREQAEANQLVTVLAGDESLSQLDRLHTAAALHARTPTADTAGFCSTASSPRPTSSLTRTSTSSPWPEAHRRTRRGWPSWSSTSMPDRRSSTASRQPVGPAPKLDGEPAACTRTRLGAGQTDCRSTGPGSLCHSKGGVRVHTSGNSDPSSWRAA